MACDFQFSGSTLWMGMGLKNVYDVTGIPLKDLIVINLRSWKPTAVIVDGQQRI